MKNLEFVVVRCGHRSCLNQRLTFVSSKFTRALSKSAGIRMPRGRCTWRSIILRVSSMLGSLFMGLSGSSSYPVLGKALPYKTNFELLLLPPIILISLIAHFNGGDVADEKL